MRTLRAHSVNNLQKYHTAVVTIVIMLYVTSGMTVLILILLHCLVFLL